VVPGARKTENPWETIPKKSQVIFVAAVFFTFSTLGMAADISGLGRQPLVRFAAGVAMSGGFAAIYAWSGVRLRARWWMVFVPLFVIQTFLMSFLGHRYPDLPMPNLMTGGELAGIRSRLNFDTLSITIATVLAYVGFLAVFISEFRRHVRVTAEKTVLESEMAAARAVQQVIVPEHAECFLGFCVDTAYIPAKQVGGDFFQILPDGEGGMLAVIGDVAGKGLPAAMLVSMLVGSIRTAAESSHDPARILSILHDRLAGRGEGGFSTAIAARIERDGRVTLANAGHLPPYLDGREMEFAGSLPLGFAGGGQYQATTFTMTPGERLVFCTDGVVEAQDHEGKLFGFDRTRQISTKTAVEIAEAAVAFGQSDDITVVAIEKTGTWG
jgi:hypothetical protein